MTPQLGTLTLLVRTWPRQKDGLGLTSSWPASVLINARDSKGKPRFLVYRVSPRPPFLSANRFLLLLLMFCFGYWLIDLLIYIYFLFDVYLRPLRLCQQGMATRKNSEQSWNSCKFWDLLRHVACVVFRMGFWDHFWKQILHLLFSLIS